MILDLFAGPGGWSVGLNMLGHHDVGVEFDKAACQTRSRAGHLSIQADVAAYPTAPFRGRVTGLIASPPCQDFSVAGRKAGIDGYRGRLIHEVLRWTNDLRPDWVACEQVPVCLPIWQDFARIMRDEWGYYVWSGVLNAADFGVPQTRKRAILMASKQRFGPPQPTHTERPTDDIFGSGLLPWVSMAQALGWNEADRVGFPRRNDQDDGATHRVRDLRSADQPAFAMTSKIRSWKRVLDEQQQLPEILEQDDSTQPVMLRGGMWSNNNRLYDPASEPAPTVAFGNDSAGWAWTRPATTVVSSFRPDIIAAPGWRVSEADGSRQDAEGSIRVTIPEVSILQSFPADYPWVGSKTKQYQQVGNAVPPLLARAILKELV